MNLFRSEEHARRWEGYRDEMADAVRPVAEWAELFSNPFFRERTRPDYISWLRSDAGRDAYLDLRSRLPRASEP